MIVGLGGHGLNSKKDFKLWVPSLNILGLIKEPPYASDQNRMLIVCHPAPNADKFD